jgi:hypothetical protein
MFGTVRLGRVLSTGKPFLTARHPAGWVVVLWMRRPPRPERHGGAPRGGSGSDWRTWRDPDWDDGEGLSFAFQAVRHDTADGVRIGSIDVNVRVDIAENTYMCCDRIRGFGRFLVVLADEFDPHDLNGEPLEWHTPVRRPLLGRER